MSDRVRALFDAVFRACFPATWSRGVELHRQGAVSGEALDATEATFRVITGGGLLCPGVRLFLDDLDWECDCRSRERVCEHVAAAVVAWQRASEAGQALPALAHPAGRVGYRLTRAPGGLALSRVIVGPDRERELTATLAGVAEGRVAGPRFVATREDLAVEVVLGTHRSGVLPAALVPRVLVALARCTDVSLDGRPVRVDAEPVLPRVRVEDQGAGFLLRVGPDPEIRERFANGLVLCGDRLACAGDPGLTARERADLEAGALFGPDEVARLVTEVLPGLRRRLPVDVRTRRLPETAVAAVRIALDVSREADELSVLPTLVYGDPPAARVDGDRLVHLRGPVPLRDREAERRLARRLTSLGLAPGVRAVLRGAEAVALCSRLGDLDAAVRGGGLEHFRLAPRLAPRLTLDPEGFDVSFEVPAGGAGAAAVLAAWRAGESLVPLRGGGFAPLPEDWLERFGNRVAGLLAAREPGCALPRCCLSDLAALCEELGEPVPQAAGELRRRLARCAAAPPATLPADLATALRPYQHHGVNWLVFLREAGLGGLLADDMGLGKTLQALCAIAGRTLVVAPTSVLYNWAEEARRHRPGLRVGVYHGPERALDADADLTLTTYAILRLDADRLAAVDWDCVVLDEAQNIKNPQSQAAAAAFRLRAGFRLALSGTPVENRLDELWSQMRFVNPGLLGGREEFWRQYAEPIGAGEPAAAARLRERLRPFLLRRLKRDVAAELPPRTEMTLRCELGPAEREVYDAVRAATLDEVARRLAAQGGVLAALEALLRLRQAACHAALVPGQAAAHSSKLRLLLESLDNVVADGHKALVFSQWTSLLDLTEPHLAAAGVAHLRLDGQTRDRAEVVRRFQEDERVPVLLVSLKAGGVGLNLTAADHVFLLDPWWNPAVEDQAADRAHRIGQRRPVMIYRLVAVDTVEERIVALQQRKRELAAAALGEGAGAAALSREDLLELLR